MTLLRLLAVLLFLCFVHASFARTVQREKENSADEAVKWIVSIELKGTKICEGVQVSKEWILTLGDCILKNKNEKYKIIMSNGEKRDILDKKGSSKGKMLVLLKTTISNDVEQDYPRLANTRSDSIFRMYNRNESGNFEEIGVTKVNDAKCIKQGFGGYEKSKHDCFTADQASSTNCLLNAGRPIFGKVKTEWVLYGFSTAEGDVCDNSYKQLTRVARYRRYVKKLIKSVCVLINDIVSVIIRPPPLIQVGNLAFIYGEQDSTGCGTPVGDASLRFDLLTLSTTLGAEANVTCNAGYDSPSATTITCRASGAWESASCTIKDCDSPVSDGSVRFDLLTSSTTFGSEANVTCNAGYDSPSAATSSCLASGAWESASCTIKDCDSPVSDGSVRFDLLTSSTTFGSEAKVTCNAGYDSPSAATITCLASGAWESASCTIKDCDSPVSDGSVRFHLLTSSTTFGSEANVTCNAGYDSPSAATITCLASGAWESASCTIKDCDSPVSDGSVRFDLLTSSTTFGSEASVTCNAGYDSPSAATITCLASGAWESASCTIIDCDSPVSDGSVRFDLLTSSTTFGSGANVTCNAGYDSLSAATITCLASGAWESASCTIKDCDSPVSDGSVRFDLLTSSTTFGSEASVTCNAGYDSPSAATITCLASGAWESASCTIKDCGTPSVSNGSVSLDSTSTTYLSTATVTCDAEYRPSLYEVDTKIFCALTGTWTTVFCELICNNPNEVTVDGTRYRLCDGDGSGSNGRLEVFQNNEWGTVCEDYWNSGNSETACKMFGYSDGSKLSVTPGWGPIWLDNVDCNSDQNHIVDCLRGISTYTYYTTLITYTYSGFIYSTYTTRTRYGFDHYSIGEHNCDHNQDVGISCLE